MLRIQEPVVFIRGLGRGDDQDAVFGLAHKFVADPGELSRPRGAAPVRWEFFYRDAFGRQIGRNFGSDQNQVGRRFVGVEVDKVLQHRQGLVFGSVSETSAGA